MTDIDKKMVKSVLAKYGIKPDNFESIAKNVNRQVWRVTHPKGVYALKFVDNYGRAQRITAINEHLHQQGLPVVTVLSTKQGSPFVSTDLGYFMFFPWVEGEHPSYKTPGMIERVAVLLARFHEASRGYVATGGPITDLHLDLHEIYKRKVQNMENSKRKTRQLDDPFTKLFLSELPWLYARINWVLDRHPHTALGELIAQSKHDPILAHSDYSVHNLLLGNNEELTIIDMDQVSIALPIVDISNLITWVSYRTGSWSADKMNLVLTSYQQVRRLSPEEHELILIDQIFPYRALALAKRHFLRKQDAKSLQWLKRCLRIDREKIAGLGIGPK